MTRMVRKVAPTLCRWLALDNLVLLCVVLGCLAMPAAAEIYQWRDASGKLHFSDKKPKQQEAEAVSYTLGKINTDDSTQEREKLERLFKPETAAEKAQRQQDMQQQAQREQQHQQRCHKARNYLKGLQGRVSFVREDGSVYTVSEAERQQQEAELQAQIRQYCG